MAALDYTVERVKKLEAENERLQAQVKEMETKNNTLQAHAQKTTKSNEMLNIEKLNKRVTTLAGANVRLEGRLDEHDMEIEDLQCEVAGMGDSETIERWLLDELDSLKYLIESKEQSLKDEIAKLANKSGEGMRKKRTHGSIEREALEKRQPPIPDSPLAALEDAICAREKKRKTNDRSETATLSNSRAEPSA